MSDLTDALGALQDHLGVLQAIQHVTGAVEAAGDVPTLIAQLEAECADLEDRRDVLTIELETLRRERERMSHD